MRTNEPWETDEPVSSADVIGQIIELNEQIRSFWSRAAGWAPLEAAHLLSKSRLDRQVALSRTLRLWIDPSPESEMEGRLILAWANLGSLVEGTLKLYLSVWLTDYRRDAARRHQLGNMRDPDVLGLEDLRRFINTEIFDGAWSWNDWVLLVQQRRNAIHAYRQRELGSFVEFEAAVRRYLEFLMDINTSLPYP